MNPNGTSMNRHRTSQQLFPRLDELVDTPQLSSLTLLQLALLVVPRDLDIHQPCLGALCDILDDAPHTPVPPLLAQLICDRCRDLDHLITAYRQALTSNRPDHNFQYDPPF